jgi:hypothetical protein
MSTERDTEDVAPLPQSLKFTVAAIALAVLAAFTWFVVEPSRLAGGVLAAGITMFVILVLINPRPGGTTVGTVTDHDASRARGGQERPVERSVVA